MLERVGGFDEQRFPFGYEDLELARRMSDHGFKLLYNEAAVGEHLKTEKLDGWRRNLRRIAQAERRFTELYPGERAYFYERFRAAAAAPVARGRSARLARFVRPGVPWLGRFVWRSYDLVCRQQLAPEFLAEWEAAGAAEGSSGTRASEAARAATPSGPNAPSVAVDLARLLAGPRLMSWLRQRWVIFRHPLADIRFGRNVRVGPGFSLFIPENGSFIVGDDVEFRRDFRAEVSATGRVTIGSGTVFTYSVLIQCTTTIDIGERCMFGQTTILLDGQHRFRDLSQPMLEQGYEFTPLRIDDDAVITTKCTIMANIGRRAFIGANSVVSRPIPAYTVAVGAPARPIEYFGPPGDEPAELPANTST